MLHRCRRRRRPDYYEKEMAHAERRGEQAEEREAERKRREDERSRKFAERERARKAMFKARAGGQDGRRKLGREGGILLDRVRKMMGKRG